MVKKISNIQFEKTDAVEMREWGEIYARKHKMLERTNWTQMMDSNLTEEAIIQWAFWRKQVKDVSREKQTLKEATIRLDHIDQMATGLRTDTKEDANPLRSKFVLTEEDLKNKLRDIAKEFIGEIIPQETKNPEDSPHSKTDDELRILLLEKIIIKYHNTLAAIAPPEETEILREKFEQALDLMSSLDEDEEFSNLGSYPLINLIHKETGIPVEKLVHDIVVERKERMRQYYILEGDHLRLQKRLKSATVRDELLKIWKLFE